MQGIKKIFVDTTVEKSKYTQGILERLPRIPVEYTNNTRDLFDEINQADDPISAGKQILVIERNKGAFLKKCPGTKEYICCGYQILNFSTQCDLECSYCILQAYFNNPALRIFANLDEMFAELQEKIDDDKQHLWRIGTGEFTDSLSLEEITGFSEYVIPFFIERKNTILELKTKTTNVAFLKKFDPQGRIMLAWSLNSERIQREEEKKTPPIKARIDAAKVCLANGYRISFHFDPIIYYAGWEGDYQKTIDYLFSSIDPNKISWISMGCFRFMPQLKDVITQRHPRSVVLLGEFIKGLDGKMRYPKPLRIDLYKKMATMLHHTKHNFKLYLCMESDEVWRKALDFSPKDSAGLIEHLDRAVFT
jgi:spore photoproduct lyase